MARAADVIITEKDNSLYSAGQSEYVGAMLGIADKGPIGEATLVTSWPEFESIFGSYRTDSYLAYAAKRFFDLGSLLWVVRTAHYTNVTDAATLEAVSAEIVINEVDDITPALEVKAVNEGTAFNGIKVRTTVDTGIYTFEVLDANDVVLETYTDLVMTPINNSRYIENIVNGDSQYVTVNVLTAAAKATTATLAGGLDAVSSIADADFIGDESQANGLYAFDTVEHIDEVAVPGIATPAVQAALSAWGQVRTETSVILTTPQGLSYSEAVDYRKGQGAYTHAALQNDSASMYWPWVSILDPQTSSPISIPVEGDIMGLSAKAQSDGNVWDAVAGLNRGVIQNVLGLDAVPTKAHMNVLQSAQVNPITKFTSGGVVVWGQRTLTTKTSALDRKNVRRLTNFLKVQFADTSRFLLFEPNTKRSREGFKRFAEPIMEDVRNKEGVYDYRVICDLSNNTSLTIDRNQLIAWVFFKPTKTAEEIRVELNITDTGVDFSEL